MSAYVVSLIFGHREAPRIDAAPTTIAGIGPRTTAANNTGRVRNRRFHLDAALELNTPPLGDGRRCGENDDGPNGTEAFPGPKQTARQGECAGDQDRGVAEHAPEQWIAA